MKTRHLILGIGAVLATVTLNATANDIALSPRAAGNQIVTAKSGTDYVAAPVTGAALSPRAAANQTVAAKGSENVDGKCVATGSPKHVATAGKAAKMSCCNLTMGECTTMRSMEK